MRFFMLALLFVLVVFSSTVQSQKIENRALKTLYRWKYIDFLWESLEDRNRAIRDGTYDPSMGIPMDFEKTKDGRVFITLEGDNGVPARLNTISNFVSPDSGPLLQPYPDWAWHRSRRCGVSRVFRIALDKCDRLWVLDAGTFVDDSPVCLPKLLIFDVKSDRLIEQIRIPTRIAWSANNETLLSNPIVETEGQFCQDTTVYIADTYSYGLIVYRDGKFKRYESPLFNPSNDAKDFVIDGSSFEFPAGGLLGLSLSPKIFPSEKRFLYLRPISSFGLFATNSKDLKDKNLGEDVNFFGIKNALSSQAVGQVFSREGTLFLGLTTDTALVCFNRYNYLSWNNLITVAQDRETLNYMNSLKVIPPKWYGNAQEELWVLSNKFLAYLSGNLDTNEYNFHLLAAPVQSLIAGTQCKIPKELEFFLREDVSKQHN